MTTERRLRKTRSARGQRRSRELNDNTIDADADSGRLDVNCARPERLDATKPNLPVDGVQVMEGFASTEKESDQEFVRHTKSTLRRKSIGWKPCYTS